MTRSPGWLPHGRALATEEFLWRHRILCWLLALHIPGVVVAARVTGRGELNGAGGALLLAALLGVALAPLPRRVRAGAVAVGLLTSSGLLVHLTRQGEELHLHILLALAAAALYQDWVVYGTAVAYVAAGQAVVVVFGNVEVYGHEGAALVWVVTHLAFGVVGTGVLLLFWRADEIARASAEALAHELHDGDQGVRARLAEADRIRADLIATVSHEFRTPLTGIRGAALTLLQRGERLGPAARSQLLHAVVEQEERLSRLLENMLTAASATAPDPTAEADVGSVAASVVAQSGRSANPVSVLVEQGSRARMTPQALHQVLANLLDNAVQHGAAGGVPLLAAGQEGAEVWIAVTNEGAGIDAATAGRLFEPFTQLASGPTRDREGLGMGLYVVRRLVEVHGGRVAVRSLDGWVTVEVRVPAAYQAQTPVPTALPIA
ncbi:MAG: ATP-binding protein [Mycobacteriales bacterium]|nr:ATP-binding protein [Mycobacteriales bacterium]